MKRKLILFFLSVMGVSGIYAQPRYDMDHISREKLDRGVVAFRYGQHVVVSWRTLTSDAVGQPYDIYRNGVKLNKVPLTKGGTFFTDDQPPSGNVVYEVRGGGKDGRYVLNADAPEGYIPVRLQKPADGTTPDGRSFGYMANDASVGDVDGDGQYEIILKWDPTNAHDNAHDGFTGSTLFDCYRLDGTLLWRIDMGINIRSGAHYVPFVVYDFDGDGKAELMVRTADGTRDGQGKVIGDSLADYRHRPVADTQQPTPEQEWGRYNRQGRPMTGRILKGPDFITVFNGMTGAAMDTQPYNPQRGDPLDWGDSYANRSDRLLAAVGYFGNKPSAIFCRGYYTRSVLAAWDWDGKHLSNRWTFDTNQPEWASYAGQGNHNLRVADVDGDGMDEITYGSMAVDHDGRGLYNTGMGHGDAIHLMAFDPQSTELQVWDCHENRRDGSELRDARSGKVIFQILSNTDVGRCMAADIDPNNPGLEMWSSASGGICNVRGEVIDSTARIPINFGIWWDGDLCRELLDHERVSKYSSRSTTTLAHFSDCAFNNGSKSNPALCADVLGDWREEVLTRTADNRHLRLYITPIPTKYRFHSFLAEPVYRHSVTMQNVGYNQPTNVGFYFGAELKGSGKLFRGWQF
jgi:rhamnogalacturonan endolyase